LRNVRVFVNEAGKGGMTSSYDPSLACNDMYTISHFSSKLAHRTFLLKKLYSKQSLVVIYNRMICWNKVSLVWAGSVSVWGEA
jgi:hypothetical protein